MLSCPGAVLLGYRLPSSSLLCQPHGVHRGVVLAQAIHEQDLDHVAHLAAEHGATKPIPGRLRRASGEGRVRLLQ
jgi:hypothetical protein